MYLEYGGLFAKLRTRYFRKVLERLRAEGCTHLLDYGCGPGDVLEICQMMDIPAVGLDNAQRSVDLAIKKGLKAIHGNETSSLLVEQQFDTVFMQSVIEHLPNPLGTLERLVDLLPAGGLLFISAPTPCSTFWDDPTHVRPFTPKSFVTLAELLSIEVLEINYVFAYLLNLRLTSSAWYKLINIIPMPLGSNLVGLFRKRP